MWGLHGSKGLFLVKGLSLGSILWALFALPIGLGIQLSSFLLFVVGFLSLGLMKSNEAVARNQL